MASLIAKQPKDTKKQTTVSLSGTVLADLELYCQFIDSARDWVINEALKSVFRRDKAFLEWKVRDEQKSTTEIPSARNARRADADANSKLDRTRPSTPASREPSSAA